MSDMKYLVNFPTRLTKTSELAVDNNCITNITSKKLKITGIITEF